MDRMDNRRFTDFRPRDVLLVAITAALSGLIYWIAGPDTQVQEVEVLPRGVMVVRKDATMRVNGVEQTCEWEADHQHIIANVVCEVEEP
jgi:hypothetical protein